MNKWILGNAWRREGPSFVVAANGDSPSRAAFEHDITDMAGYNGEAQRPLTVPDAKVSFDIELQDDTGTLDLVFVEGEREFVLRLRAEKASGSTCLLGSERPLATAGPVFLCKGQKHRVEFWNLDGLIGFELDGKAVFSYEHKSRLPEERDWMEGTRCGFRMAARELKATLTNLRLQRDLYYRGDAHPIDIWGRRRDESVRTYAIDEPLQLGPDDFFALGDNSTNSKDSRMWGVVPRKNLIGQAFAIFWPLTHIRLIR